MSKHAKTLDTRKLEAVEFDGGSRELRVRFDDGCLAAVAVTAFDGFPTKPVKAVSMDRFRHGIEFTFADGSSTDVAADLITWLTNEDYARSYPRDEELGPRIGSNVARLRKQQNITQLELAAEADLQPPNLSRLEAGKHVPTLDVLLRIARALKVSLPSLLSSPQAIAANRSGVAIEPPGRPIRTVGENAMLVRVRKRAGARRAPKRSPSSTRPTVPPSGHRS